MKHIFATVLIVISICLPSKSQNTLFDDTRLSSIYITISPDSLAILYDSVLADHYYMVRFVFDDQVHQDTVENVGFRLRGNTSRYSAKKSFKISFNEYVPGRKYQEVKKINLNGEHNDPTMIREKLFYDLWKRAGMPERRTTFVRVYVNEEYYGLYTNLEELDKDWLSREFADNGGNLYKCTYPANLVYHGTDPEYYKNLQNSTTTGGRVYDLQTNETEDDYTRLVELISALHASQEQIPAVVPSILEVDEFLKALALDVATGNWDDYGFNQNNYYLYDNPAGLKFSFITYDPDNTFGVDWFGIDWAKRDCRSWINPGLQLPLAEKLLAVPDFYDRYKLFLDTIARLVINPDLVFPHIDSLKALIYQAAQEDTWRTMDYGYTMGDFNQGFIGPVDGHTPYGIKPFLTTRKQYILEQLYPQGVPNDWNYGDRLALSPNPASDHITLWFRGVSGTEITIWIVDLTGKLRSEFVPEPRTGNSMNLPVGNLENGLYLLMVRAGRDLMVKKFLVSR